MVAVHMPPEIVEPSGSLIKVVVYFAGDVIFIGAVCFSARLLDGEVMIRSTLTCIAYRHSGPLHRPQPQGRQQP